MFVGCVLGGRVYCGVGDGIRFIIFVDGFFGGVDVVDRVFVFGRFIIEICVFVYKYNVFCRFGIIFVI